MTHMPGKEIPGKFVAGRRRLTSLRCPKCKLLGFITIRPWESSDGAYEDEKYECQNCGHYWWTESADA